MTKSTLSGETRKAQGQSRALRRAGSAWLNRALAELKTWLGAQYLAWNLTTVTMDAFRTTSCCPEPPHPNAWGALPRAAVRAGLIQPSLLTQKAKRLKAHARRVQVWNICPDAV